MLAITIIVIRLWMHFTNGRLCSPYTTCTPVQPQQPHAPLTHSVFELAHCLPLLHNRRPGFRPAKVLFEQLHCSKYSCSEWSYSKWKMWQIKLYQTRLQKINCATWGVANKNVQIKLQEMKLRKCIRMPITPPRNPQRTWKYWLTYVASGVSLGVMRRGMSLFRVAPTNFARAVNSCPR